ncbi:phosphoglycerate kinase [Acidobacteria bacterium AH-259-O06]|nr:phosphoglycerate kinase [Acidobacteria bacterium AH-259-O06]
MNYGFSKLSIRDLELEGKHLFIRVDFNVPLKGGSVIDDTRIKAALPTLEMAAEKKACIVLASHLGRPGGKRQEEFSLRPVAHHLSSLMKQEIAFVVDCIGPEVEENVKTLQPGRLLLLENLRFHEGETKNDPDFSRKLGAWMEEYVNDAFGAAHRAHASTAGLPQILGRGAAGLLMEKELEYLSRVLLHPQHPVVAILGGAKVSDKMEVIENLLSLADVILIGGGMAFTFLKAQNKNIGKSIVEKDNLEFARDLMESAASHGVVLRFPVDSVIAQKREPGVQTRVAQADGIPEDWIGLDIGPRTVEEFKKEIWQAQTIIWNGPLGVFEIDGFADGTLAIARAVAESDALSVVGGGDSVSAVIKAGVQNEITHISTGGGASLEFLAGKTLPGVEILTDR